VRTVERASLTNAMRGHERSSAKRVTGDLGAPSTRRNGVPTTANHAPRLPAPVRQRMPIRHGARSARNLPAPGVECCERVAVMAAFLLWLLLRRCWPWRSPRSCCTRSCGCSAVRLVGIAVGGVFASSRRSLPAARLPARALRRRSSSPLSGTGSGSRELSGAAASPRRARARRRLDAPGFLVPVQRQRLPASAARTSRASGGLAASSAEPPSGSRVQ